ncbi:hypothetical protein F5051DRAFT_434108, partial [Lentinula edodes]
ALQRNGDQAFGVAKNYVLSQEGYNIAAGTSQDICAAVTHLLATRPFLRGPNATVPEMDWIETWQTLGDSGLIKVTAALAHGYLLEGSATQALYSGYSPRIVAAAVYLLSCAVDEWSEGYFKEVHWKTDGKRQLTVDNFEKMILQFKRKNSQAWVEFRLKVDTVIVTGVTHQNFPKFNRTSAFNTPIYTAMDPDSDPEEVEQGIIKPTINLELMQARQVIAEAEAALRGMQSNSQQNRDDQEIMDERTVKKRRKDKGENRKVKSKEERHKKHKHHEKKQQGDEKNHKQKGKKRSRESEGGKRQALANEGNRGEFPQKKMLKEESDLVQHAVTRSLGDTGAGSAGIHPKAGWWELGRKEEPRHKTASAGLCNHHQLAGKAAGDIP